MTPPWVRMPTSRTLDPDRAQDDYERLLEECRLADEALAAASYEDTITARAGVMSVRTVVVHMIEEYAQHNGHADLLRERIDGTTDKQRPAPYAQPELPLTPPPSATGTQSADGPLTARTSAQARDAAQCLSGPAVPELDVSPMRLIHRSRSDGRVKIRTGGPSWAAAH